MNVHPNAIKLITGRYKSYRNIRNYLKELGCTKSEQTLIIQMIRKEGHKIW